jgi:hypothetical protein
MVVVRLTPVLLDRGSVLAAAERPPAGACFVLPPEVRWFANCYGQPIQSHGADLLEDELELVQPRRGLRWDLAPLLPRGLEERRDTLQRWSHLLQQVSCNGRRWSTLKRRQFGEDGSRFRRQRQRQSWSFSRHE